MKSFLYLLTFATSRAISCEPTAIADLRQDVEVAFKNKTFATLVEKYGGSAPAQVRLHNYYKDDSPVTIHRFDNLSGLATWFDETHEHFGSMIVPDKVTCRDFECAYVLPELTLHHGTYLRGFERVRSGNCTYLTELSINWE